MNKRGAVLVHVLITSILVMVVATGLAQMLIQRQTISLKAAQGAAGRKQTEATLARLLSDWNQNGVCSAVTGYQLIAGATGRCDCRYRPLYMINPGCQLTQGPGQSAAEVTARCVNAAGATIPWTNCNAGGAGRCSLSMTTCP
jgi:hypothetical protein